MTDLLKAEGITGIWAILIVAAIWLGQRFVNGLLEQRLKKDLVASELRLTKLLESQVQVDLDLRNKRDDVYKALWQAGVDIPRYPPNESLSYSELDRIAQILKEWYYERSGGLYLSNEARNAYVFLQETLMEVGDRRDGSTIWATDQAEYLKLHAAFSKLRTELTNDLQSRVRRFLAT